jgi:dolichol-phosphate mannosyltransferase
MNSIIVIPTYNEKDNIRPLVEEIFKVTPDINILIVDDNSPDGTGRIADELSKKYSQVKVLHREKKEGLGKAYIVGFKEALNLNPDYIIQMDADFSHSPKYIPLFLSEISNYDIVLGSRFLNTRHPQNVSSFSLWANRYIRWITGMKITDCLGGFKCFRQKVIEKVDLNKFISSGFIFQAEFLYRALKEGFSIHEIPIIFYLRPFGLSKKSKTIIIEALFKTPLFRLF